MRRIKEEASLGRRWSFSASTCGRGLTGGSSLLPAAAESVLRKASTSNSAFVPPDGTFTERWSFAVFSEPAA
jgi:hypothetical protein